MTTDWWAHHYADNPKAAEEIEDEDFDLQAELARIEAEEEAAAQTDDWEDVSK